MASECKLCAVLGATDLTDSLDGDPMTHSELHARQSRLIIINHEQIQEKKPQKSALFRFCRELVNIHRENSEIKCSQCTRSIRSNGSATTACIINHVCSHLNMELFACRQCHLKFVSRGGVYAHLRKIHALNGIRANYVDMTDDHQSDIMDMVKLCFHKAPRKQIIVTAFVKKKHNHSRNPLVKLAHGYLAKYQKGINIQCQLCPTSISHNNPTTANRIVDHSRWHLDKQTFSCRLCNYSSSTDYSIRAHLNNSHSVAGSKLNFKDESSEYVQEMSSMLEDCFGNTKKEKPVMISEEEKRIRRAESNIRIRCGDNLLLAERQLRCAACKKVPAIWQTAMPNLSEELGSCVDVPMRHALHHLNKILFTCRHCSYSSKPKQIIGLHVRSKHSRPTKEFDDRTDDFHAEVMDMLSKCFDWDL